MTKLIALVAAFALAPVLLAAAPPVQEMLLSQSSRPDALYLGSKTKPVIVQGSLNVQGSSTGVGLTLNNAITCGGAAACGSIALVSGSPSTATVTVPSTVSCVCFPVGNTAAIAAAGCAASVSGTTLTLTGPNTVTTTVRYMCFL